MLILLILLWIKCSIGPLTYACELVGESPAWFGFDNWVTVSRVKVFCVPHFLSVLHSKFDRRGSILFSCFAFLVITPQLIWLCFLMHTFCNLHQTTDVACAFSMVDWPCGMQLLRKQPFTSNWLWIRARSALSALNHFVIAQGINNSGIKSSSTDHTQY
jgi:hypothetical protein